MRLEFFIALGNTLRPPQVKYTLGSYGVPILHAGRCVNLIHPLQLGSALASFKNRHARRERLDNSFLLGVCSGEPSKGLLQVRHLKPETLMGVMIDVCDMVANASFPDSVGKMSLDELHLDITPL